MVDLTNQFANQTTKKYKLDLADSKLVEGRTLYRVVALRDFGDIKEGEKGGYIQSEDNLSHEGQSWIGNDAMVYGDAWVGENAWVSGNAKVWGNVFIFGNARVSDNVRIYDHARIFGAAQISEHAIIRGAALISGSVTVSGKAIVYGAARLSDFEAISGDCMLSGADEDDFRPSRTYRRSTGMPEEDINADRRKKRKKEEHARWHGWL